jgi:hypothetical protein
MKRIFESVVASLSMPIVYAPMALQLSPATIRAFDAGMLHRSPMQLALSPDITRIFVVTP